MREYAIKFSLILMLMFIQGCAGVSTVKLHSMAQQTGVPIVITHFGIDLPHSAGGVNVGFVSLNTSSKTIKYIVYTVRAKNNVEDFVRCTISGKIDERLEVVGPTAPTEKKGGVWNNVWYNHSIKKAVLTRVDITFMDGSKKVVVEPHVKKLFKRYYVK